MMSITIENIYDDMSNSDEIWREIPNTDGYYEVSNLGRVRSWRNNRFGRMENPRIMKLGNHNGGRSGYYKITMSFKGKGVKQSLVHRLVAQAFIPNPENKPEVNHLDGNGRNNHVSNLEWCTRSENAQHMQDNLKQEKVGSERYWTSKVNELDVLDMRALYNQGWFTLTEIGDAWGLHNSTVYQIVKNKTWRHI